MSEQIPHVEYGPDEAPHARCPFNRAATEQRFDSIDRRLDDIVALLTKQNGRVGKTEQDVSGLKAGVAVLVGVITVGVPVILWVAEHWGR